MELSNFQGLGKDYEKCSQLYHLYLIPCFQWAWACVTSFQECWELCPSRLVSPTIFSLFLCLAQWGLGLGGVKPRQPSCFHLLHHNTLAVLNVIWEL